jgi:diaminohydroxyphosphoribosylaminopyrimidine deaminase/5-amino-6-(5-phosphoribosylamino)uracil reductase
MKQKHDIEFMNEALRLARMMAGRTSPDPMVGAVVVRGGVIVGSGYHGEVGSPHAEAIAIKKAGAGAKGATLYVNLEPCCHFGNNPPCADTIITSGIKRVVTAMKDPNPLVSGKGFRKLKNAGVKVDVGLLGDQAEKLNEAFVKFMTTGTPFVILKSAMSLDGKIATVTGQSEWISGEASRKMVHILRSHVDAVMTSIVTVLVDDPMLTVRMVKGRNPLKMIIDPEGRIPLGSKILKNEPWKTMVVVTEKAPSSKIKALEKLDAEVIITRSSGGMIDLKQLMRVLADRGIMSIMVEAGGGLAACAIRAEIVDKIMYFIAPMIIGGATAPTPVEGDGIVNILQALKLKKCSFSKVGDDLLVEGYLR